MTDLLILIAVAGAAAAIGAWLGIVVIARPMGRALDHADEDRGTTTMEESHDESTEGD